MRTHLIHTGHSSCLALVLSFVVACSGGDNGPTNPDGPGAPVASVEVSLAADMILVGETTNASAVLRNEAGEILTGRTVTWSSSNTTAASVDGSGVVTGEAAGEAEITATSEGHSHSADLLVQSLPTEWTVQPAGAWDTEASVRGEDSFSLLAVFCDLASDGSVLWGFNLRQLGEVPFTNGIEFPLLPEQAGDPSWSFNASTSHGGALTLSVGTADTPGTAGEMQALLRNREEAVLTYPTGNPVQSVTVRFDLRDGARAIAEAEAACAAG